MYDHELLHSLVSQADRANTLVNQAQQERDWYLRLIGYHAGILSPQQLTEDDRDLVMGFIQEFKKNHVGSASPLVNLLVDYLPPVKKRDH